MENAVRDPIEPTDVSGNRENGYHDASDRAETMDGLRHLVRLVSWYAQSPDPHAYDPFGARIVEAAAVKAREHLGWTLRDRLELRLARATNRVAAEFRKAGAAQLESWRRWGAHTLGRALPVVSGDEIEEALSRFLKRYSENLASTDGVVEQLIAAIEHHCHWKSVTAVRPLREETRNGLPCYGAVCDPLDDNETVVPEILLRGDSGEWARFDKLAKEMWPRQRRPGRRPPVPPLTYVPLDEVFDTLPSEFEKR